MMHNPNTCFESYDKNDMILRKMEGVVFHGLMSENVGISSIEKFILLRWYKRVRYEKENNHYVYHNAATITIPIGCPTTPLS